MTEKMTPREAEGGDLGVWARHLRDVAAKMRHGLDRPWQGLAHRVEQIADGLAPAPSVEETMHPPEVATSPAEGEAAPKVEGGDRRSTVLADREAELLEVKGPCRAQPCRLHLAHRGPCDTRAPARPLAVGDTVETEAQLDALPVGAVVLGRVVMQRKVHCWEMVGVTGRMSRPAAQLPAKVLDLPEDTS